jgi:predicted dehydrogenase
VKTYNVGIIGFGMIGKVHAYCYRVLPFYYDFVAENSSGVKADNGPLFYDPLPLEARITHVVTSRPETAEKARQTIGAEAAATDYRVVTEDPRISRPSLSKAV